MPDGVDIVEMVSQKPRTAYEGANHPKLYHYYAGHDDNRDWFMLI